MRKMGAVGDYNSITGESGVKDPHFLRGPRYSSGSCLLDDWADVPGGIGRFRLDNFGVVGY